MRNSRNSSKNKRSPSPTPSSQASPRAKARKSFTSRGGARAPVSNPASVPSTSQAGRVEMTGGGPNSKREKSSSSIKPAPQKSMSQLMRGQSSSDSEDADQTLVIVRKSKAKQARKRTHGSDSGSDASDGYVPPATSKMSNSVPSGSRTVSSSQSLNDSGRSSVANTSTFRTSGITPSNQTGFLKKMINKCVYYIFVADQKKYPIKKADILKYVFEDQGGRENYSTVIVEANKILKNTFGLELLQLQNQKGSYIIINILDKDIGALNFAEYPEDEKEKKGLIFFLLTTIFMNNNAISEEKLFKALERMGINLSSTVPHPVFGNVKRYITSELVRQMYLEYTRVNKDPVQYEFTWGERAYQEYQKKDLLEFTCRTIGDCEPEDFKLQYIDSMSKPVRYEN